MSEPLIALAEAEAGQTQARFGETLTAVTEPDIAQTAAHVLTRLRETGQGQVLDDEGAGNLNAVRYDFRLRALEAIAAGAPGPSTDVRNVLRLVDKRVYSVLEQQAREAVAERDRTAGRPSSTNPLAHLGQWWAEQNQAYQAAVAAATAAGTPPPSRLGFLLPTGRRDAAPLALISPHEQRVRRELDQRAEAFDPSVNAVDRDLLRREIARLAPQRLVFDRTELIRWIGATNLPGVTPATTALKRLQDVVGDKGLRTQGSIPLMAYLRGREAVSLPSLQTFYTEVQGGDVDKIRTEFMGTTGSPGLKSVYEAEKKRHEDVDKAFRAELEEHDKNRRTHERDQNTRVAKLDDATGRLGRVQEAMRELLLIPDKITRVKEEIGRIPASGPAPSGAAPSVIGVGAHVNVGAYVPSPTPPGAPIQLNISTGGDPGKNLPDANAIRRGQLNDDLRKFEDRKAELEKEVVRLYKEYAGEFATEITAEPDLFDNSDVNTLDSNNIQNITDTPLESLTTTIAALRRTAKQGREALGTRLEAFDQAKRDIEKRQGHWEDYKKTPYEDRVVPAPDTCLPNEVPLAAPPQRVSLATPNQAALNALRAHSLDSLKTRHDDASRGYTEALAKVADSPFRKTPLAPEILLYELQLRDNDLQDLVSPERETRALVRTMLLMHESSSRANEGATQRRARYIHVGAQATAGVLDTLKGGLYRPFEEIQRDTFARDDRLKGVADLTLKSTVRDVLGKVSSGAVNEEQLQFYIYQLELLAQDRLEGANLAHGEDVRDLIHNLSVAYYTLKARSILADIGDRDTPLDKASELRAKLLEATKTPEAPALKVETSREATNRHRLEEARAEAEAETEAEGPAHQRVETIEKWGMLADLMFGAKGVWNVLARVGHWLDRRKTKQLPPPPG